MKLICIFSFYFYFIIIWLFRKKIILRLVVRRTRDPETFDSSVSENQHPNITNDSTQISVDPSHAEEDEEPKATTL